MSAIAGLRRLRERGFQLDVDVGLTGPEAPDLPVIVAWLEAHWTELERALRCESHPLAATAREIFGAELTEVHANRRPPQTDLFGPAIPGDPYTWRNAREFERHLRAIGAELYRDSRGWLTCIAPAEHFSHHVAAGLRIWRAELLRIAKPTDDDVREPKGWSWLRV